MNKPDVYLLHAYSSRNSGDGLLVKLSLKAIRAVGIDDVVTIVCLDPASFDGYLDDADVRLWSLARFCLETVRGLGRARPALFFGVGGGYLRASSGIEGWKSLIAHGSQLACAALRRSKRSIYLPQSIGPLKSLPGTLLAALVRRCVDVVFLRDDQSVDELAHPHGIRTGDLVVLEIGRTPRCESAAKRSIERTRPIRFVFRDLKGKPYRDDYVVNLRCLRKLLPEAGFALQSSGRGNGDDTFYRDRFGVGQVDDLATLVARERPVVVSVRLHGSLESVLAGVPSIHIAYERKGHAAYDDLGLSRYVVHASDFDANRVAALAREVAEDDGAYWQAMRAEGGGRYNEMVERIRHEIEQFHHLRDGR
ncbi:polysaccharide pyruvyl transferase family protein [Burkholderia cenocepacia]|uniref:polysaccharide pyruvyl transferase family protein n=1 Tax=Burkholderia cepacia complex TaxID=87882 RepID=UPI001B970F62|nr:MULTISPECIES: polysaccharide pyruvyl transferase family protein [Burkholderia cepacia complex]ELW9445336.1 polysaccharide pyruvyl transferase family protein [Burkholderia cenocepacia]MBR8483869.1 polysaccharide pyruvyl transferase family protein [Burkholderia cenocepacia]MDN7472301.1 polysaccharide pyruvyl transferase family protein [Burkholderia orbicola]MDN7506476.1 polysaccharide pyruvyl transferase family protein [Burkholderia orbicola]